MGLTDIRRAEFHAVTVAAEEMNHVITVKIADALLQFRAEIARKASCIALSQDALVHPCQEGFRTLHEALIAFYVG